MIVAYILASIVTIVFIASYFHDKNIWIAESYIEWITQLSLIDIFYNVAEEISLTRNYKTFLKSKFSLYNPFFNNKIKVFRDKYTNYLNEIVANPMFILLKFRYDELVNGGVSSIEAVCIIEQEAEEGKFGKTPDKLPEIYTLIGKK